MSFLTKEPAAVAGLVQAALALAVTFGAKLSTEQIGAILAFTAALMGFLVRSRVSPTQPLPKDPPSDKTPPTGTAIPVSSVPPAALALVCLALSQPACSGAQKPQPSGCGELDYAALSATCGDDEDECNRIIEGRENECSDRIRGGE
jgi:hypothetical protein